MITTHECDPAPETPNTSTQAVPNVYDAIPAAWSPYCVAPNPGGALFRKESDMTVKWVEQNAMAEPALCGLSLAIDVFTTGNTCVVRVVGDLDATTRDQLLAVSTAGHHPAIRILLGGVSFMDCSGYGALVDARAIIERQGRSITMSGQTGQPARLMNLIAELESCSLDDMAPSW